MTDENPIRDQVTQIIEGADVALFMKGTIEQPLCGNSDRALNALRKLGAPVVAVNVLPDPRIREALTEASGWPTIPQIFVKGELVGGADITEELAESGELEQLLRDKLGDGYADEREEQTVAVFAF